MTDKKPIQADGHGTTPQTDEPEVASRRGGAGESGGGAYPNPHTGLGRSRARQGSFFGHGGQSHIRYEGPENPNSITEEE